MDVDDKGMVRVTGDLCDLSVISTCMERFVNLCFMFIFSVTYVHLIHGKTE